MEQFLALAKTTRPDAILIAGDIYNRSAPPGGAVKLLDRMLTEGNRLVGIISHVERLGESILQKILVKNRERGSRLSVEFST